MQSVHADEHHHHHHHHQHCNPRHHRCHGVKVADLPPGWKEVGCYTLGFTRSLQQSRFSNFFSNFETNQGQCRSTHAHICQLHGQEEYDC